MSLSALTAEEAHTCRTMRPYCGHGFTKWLPEVYRVDLDSWETLKGGFHYRFSLTIKIKYDFFSIVYSGHYRKSTQEIGVTDSTNYKFWA